VSAGCAVVTVIHYVVVATSCALCVLTGFLFEAAASFIMFRAEHKIISCAIELCRKTIVYLLISQVSLQHFLCF